MAFDGIIVSAVVKELSALLNGGKIEKIYQPEADELVFHIHSQSANHKMYASSAGGHSRFHLLTKSPGNPQSPYAFCMLLRKHLTGGRITRIEQIGSERIIEMGVDTVNELGFSVNKVVVFEIMGKHSNIIMLDGATGKIIDSIKRISFDESRVRQVLPGKIYEYPPSQGKIPYKLITKGEIEKLCQSPSPSLSENLLKGIQGISPAMAAYLADSREPSRDIHETVYSRLTSIREGLDGETYTPAIYLDDAGRPIDFHIFPIPEYEGLCRKVEFDKPSECAEHFFVSKTGLNRLRQKKAELERAARGRLDKLYLKKQRLSEDILTAEKSDVFKLYGELLTANLHKLTHKCERAEIINYYNGQPVTISLDKRLSPAQNAQNYFKKYHKAKTAVKEKAVWLRETDIDIAYLETIFVFIENASSPDEIEALGNELTDEGYIRRKNPRAKPSGSKPAPATYRTSSGLTIMAGRNNRENDELTFKTAGRSDIWFHAKDIPGSHVILFLSDGEPTDSDILEAAAVAAFHSKGKHSENVPVDYTRTKYVKKPSRARPGMVIFTNNKTVYVSPRTPFCK